MKCGICGATTWIRKPHGRTPLPIHDMSDLNAHKWQDHREEMVKAKTDRKAKRDERTRAKDSLAERKDRARRDAAMPVVVQRREDGYLWATWSSQIIRYDLTSCRFPHPGAWGKYLGLVEDTKDALLEAWENGTAVPESELDRLGDIANNIT